MKRKRKRLILRLELTGMSFWNEQRGTLSPLLLLIYRTKPFLILMSVLLRELGRERLNPTRGRGEIFERRNGVV